MSAKKILPLFYMMICFQLNAQTYSFDYILTIENERIQPNPSTPVESQIGINSKNPDYRFFIGKDGLGTISDNKTTQNHKIAIIKKQETGKFVFNHLKSRPYPFKKNKYYYKSKKVAENKYIVQTFEDRKLKNLINEVLITLKESPLNFIFIDGDLIQEDKNEIVLQLRPILDPTKTYVVESERMDYKNGFIYEYRLKSFSIVDLRILVSNNKN